MLVCRLTQLEQALAQPQVKCLSHEGGGDEAKTVDIIKMLTNARTDYEKVRFLTHLWFSEEHCQHRFIRVCLPSVPGPAHTRTEGDRWQQCSLQKPPPDQADPCETKRSGKTLQPAKQ